MQFSSFRPPRAFPIAVAAVILSLTAPAIPRAALADSDTADAGVARISLIAGNVAIQRGDSDQTVDAVLNAPVLGADYVTTGPDSRAEVEFDGGTMVRLGDNVQMRFSHIDPSSRELQLAEGTIEFRLLHGADGQTTIDTPSISIVPRESGTYRVSVNADGQTEVTVRHGHADIQTPQGAQALDPGATLIAQGPAADPSLHTTTQVASDDFDAFNAERDRLHSDVAQAAPYVNPNVAGVEDLPTYGTWTNDSSYGQVWVPNNVSPDWAPYQNGNWVWEDAYGWTWVGAEPWGWAPYHYGRWIHSAAIGWAWYPPRPGVLLPAWSPALVGFVGFGAAIGAVNVGIGFGFGNVGWVPLAPFETFHPWWGRQATFVTNVTNVNVIATYRNARFANGVTSVSSREFAAGQFGRRVAVGPAELRSAQTVGIHGALPIVPTAANLRFTSRPGSQQVAFRPVARSFAGNGAVTPRTPFETQRQSFAQSVHLPVPAQPQRFGASSTERFGGAAPGANARGEGSIPSYSARGEGAAPAYNARGGGDVWSRFDQNRGSSSARSYGAGASGYARPQSQSPSYARPSYNAGSNGNGNGYTRPSNGAGYSRSQPESQAPSYARPSYNAGSNGNGNGYTRPSYNGNANGYARPSYNAGSGNANGYARPSYNAGSGNANGYARPSYNGNGNGYTRPQSQAPSYARPSYNGNANGYARPQAPSGAAARGSGSAPASARGGTGRDRSTSGR